MSTIEEVIKICKDKKLEEIGEGFVLYFEVHENMKYILKLKSLAYVIERKLREFSWLISESKNGPLKKEFLLMENEKKNLITRIKHFKMNENEMNSLSNYL